MEINVIVNQKFTENVMFGKPVMHPGLVMMRKIIICIYVEEPEDSYE